MAGPSLRRRAPSHPNPVPCCPPAAAAAWPLSAALRGFKWDKLCWGWAGGRAGRIKSGKRPSECRNARTAVCCWLPLKSFSVLLQLKMSLVKERDVLKEPAWRCLNAFSEVGQFQIVLS